MRYLLLFILFLAIIVPKQSYAQITEDEDGLFTIDTPLTIDLDAEEEEEERVEPKKKFKKKYFYGLKTKKRFTKSGLGESTTFELFRVLKDQVEPDPYVRDVYWMDSRRNIKRIRVGGKFDPAYGELLHGPYSKVRNGVILEEGIFYKGMKHGRWMKYSSQDILLDKEKYYKGWPKQSLVSYYDGDRTMLREVVPVEYGEKEGNYYYFFKNGLPAVIGEFQVDSKVGTWTEYYPNGKRKKIIQYQEHPYQKQYTPHVVREWNEKGEVVYERSAVQ